MSVHIKEKVVNYKYLINISKISDSDLIFIPEAVYCRRQKNRCTQTGVAQKSVHRRQLRFRVNILHLTRTSA
jgi:hypothetical protein